jgi:hypothetical protein
MKDKCVSIVIHVVSYGVFVWDVQNTSIIRWAISCVIVTRVFGSALLTDVTSVFERIREEKHHEAGQC